MKLYEVLRRVNEDLRRTVMLEPDSDNYPATHSTDLALGVAMEDSFLVEWRLARDRRFA